MPPLISQCPTQKCLDTPPTERHRIIMQDLLCDAGNVSVAFRVHFPLSVAVMANVSIYKPEYMTVTVEAAFSCHSFKVL